ncbi:MAG: hypothetical protein EPN53_06975 [Acidobacteria bacterium]|nr:MAG: hypothetical protein EPN53_06975 [Acidobacteriota bacterium]
MKTRVVARVMAVLAFVPVGPAYSGSPATVSWDRDVAPALGSVICMVRYEHKGKVGFTPTLEGCEAPAGLSPAMGAVREVFAGKVQIIVRLRSTERATEGVFRDVPEGTPDRNGVLLARYRHDLLASPRFQQLVMPGVHRALAEVGLACADCPGPRTQPPVRPVAVAALVPYAVAFYWPDGIRPDGGVSLHICVGNNGLGRMPEVDLEMADAAVAGMFANMPAVMAATRPVLVEAVKAPAYAAATDAAAKLEYLRSTLAARLPATPAFVAALAAGAAKALPAIGMTCTDCASFHVAPASGPPVTS